MMSKIAVKKYLVQLTPEERVRLDKVIGKGKCPATNTKSRRIGSSPMRMCGSDSDGFARHFD